MTCEAAKVIVLRALFSYASTEQHVYFDIGNRNLSGKLDPPHYFTINTEKQNPRKNMFQNKRRLLRLDMLFSRQFSLNTSQSSIYFTSHDNRHDQIFSPAKNMYQTKLQLHEPLNWRDEIFLQKEHLPNKQSFNHSNHWTDMIKYFSRKTSTEILMVVLFKELTICSTNVFHMTINMIKQCARKNLCALWVHSHDHKKLTWLNIYSRKELKNNMIKHLRKKLKTRGAF